MAVAAIALTANATDYLGNYSNNAGGQTSTVEGKVSIEEGTDGTSTVTIHNYAYEVYGSKHYVGNIVLNGVKTSKVGNVLSSKAPRTWTSQRVTSTHIHGKVPATRLSAMAVCP